MSLLCSHLMKQRMSERAEMLKLDDIHFYWRIDKENKNENKREEAINEFLHINESVITKSSGRSPEVKNKKKRTRQ